MELYLNVRKFLSILKWKVAHYKYWKFTELHSKHVIEKKFQNKIFEICIWAIKHILYA